MESICFDFNARRKAVNMNFEIVTDSSANLPEDIIDKYQLSILTLMFLVDGEEYYSYVKGEKTDISKFYTMMRQRKVITTSHINREMCTDLFEEILKNGKDILYIGLKPRK